MHFLHNKSALITLIFAILSATNAAQATDNDGDGVLDLLDNCSAVANADQRNTDGDLYGNVCDPDFNNDGAVNFPDLALMKSVFFLQGAFDQDMNGDGFVNFVDLSLFSEYFFSAPGPAGGLAGGITLTPAYTSAGLSNPIAMKQAPGDDSYWYAAERAGRIVRFDATDPDAVAVDILDITDRVDTFFEGGLLGFAFDPDFATNERLFLSYTADGDNGSTNPLDSRISMFTPDASMPGDFDKDSEVVIIEIDQPYGNHNGGDIAFGPDGFLYLGLGDGGSGGDPLDNGQNISTLLGSIIRLDVNVSAADISNGITYRIPAGNPYAMSASCATGCPEIFAIGLRNPWRISFDTLTDDLYTGDVGQNAREEIDLVTVGNNYGWRCYEANLTYNTTECLPASEFTFPLADYGRTLGNSVTGGYVYRGTDFPALQGVYLYADYGSGRFWGLLGGKDLGELIDTSLRPATFAQSNDGEVYVLDLWTGAIYQVGVPE